MPLLYQNNISEQTKLAIWEIDESEEFFLEKVPLQRDITHPHKRLQHLAGRYLLQFLFPGFPFEEIVIADTRKPFLPNEQYHFSISHCGKYAAAIASREKRVGIDIEIPSAKIVRIQEKFLNDTEVLLMQSLQKEMQPALLYNSTAGEQYMANTSVQLPTLIWSVKETVFKWWSYGNVDFSRQIQVQHIPGAANGIVGVHFFRDDKMLPLNIEYKLFKMLCLCWLYTDN